MRTRRAILAFVAAVSLIGSPVLAGCGLIGGNADNNDHKVGKLEDADIALAIAPTMDISAAYLAKDKGIFKKYGLNVTFINTNGGTEPFDRLAEHRADIMFATYGPIMDNVAKKAYQRFGGLKLVADASSLAPDCAVVLTMPEGPVKTIDQMAGKTVGVSSPNSITRTWVEVVLRINGVNPNRIHWAQVAFGDIPAQLKQGNIDAAFAPEPFIQLAHILAGAQTLFDVAQGPLKEFPAAGYATTGDYARYHKNTIKAFQLAMLEATNMAVVDRPAVNKALVDHAKPDDRAQVAVIAQMAKLATFQSKLNWKAIQRVPDLMKLSIDVRKIIIPTPVA